MENITITDFRIVDGHPYLKALANVTLSGLHLRGLRLEDTGRGVLALGFPGRKIQGHWQVMYETGNPETTGKILSALDSHYQMVKAVA